MLPVDLIRASVFVVILLKIAQVSAVPFGGVDAGYLESIVRYAKAAEMRNYLNESHDPCDNFYDYACGNYYRINPPYRHPFIINAFQTISDALNRKITTVLKSKSTTDTLADGKVKNFYESCMNLSILKYTYEDKLKEIIAEFGRMPALEENGNWRDSDFDWLKTVAEIAYKYQIRIILGYHIEADNANNTVNRLHIRLQDFPFESQSVYTEKTNEVYRLMRKASIANNLRKFFGLETTLADRTAKEIFDFETHLIAGNGSVTDSKENTDEDDCMTPLQPITVDEIHNKYYPDLDIKRLLNISLGFVPSVHVYDLIEDQAGHIISALKETPKRIVANYIFYYLVEDFMLSQPKTKDELEVLCVKMTKQHFSNILDNMVYRMYTTRQTEEDVMIMWQTIKSTFENVLDSRKLLWMREATRQYAKKKLKTMKMEINSYQQIDFTKEFADLTLNRHDYLQNVKSILTLNAIKSRAKLYEAPAPYDDSDMSFTPAYILTENLIKVPVSMLQPYYLWSSSYPQALKFATLGFLISHELIHGFDEEGRAFDIAGNNREWWDKDSSKYFKNRTECFSQQYQNYVYDGRNLPEMESQSENIADNGGIRLAYEAYINWYEQSLHLNRSMKLETMPRLKYTSKQLFFIGYGQLWCSATHPILRNYVTSVDEHVPDKFRVIGSLSNLQEFSKVFHCPGGSGMNPHKKCIIY